MGAAKALAQSLASRLLPQGFADDRDDAKPVRMKRYGELALSELATSLYSYAEEGSFLVATTPLGGTANVSINSAYSDTAGHLYIENTESPSNPNARSLYLGWVQFLVVIQSNTLVRAEYAAVLDNKPRARTAGSLLTLPAVSPNGNVCAAASPIIQVLDNTSAWNMAASSAAARTVARGNLSGANSINGFPVGTELVISFGRGAINALPGLTGEMIAPGKIVSNAPPVIIGPGQSLLLNVWTPSNSWNPTLETLITLWAR